MIETREVTESEYRRLRCAAGHGADVLPQFWCQDCEHFMCGYCGRDHKEHRLMKIEVV